MDVGSRIRYFREKKHLTVNKLANISGVSQSYVREIELGNKQPTVQYLEYLCYGLGITLQEFFQETPTFGNKCEICPIKTLSDTQRETLYAFIQSMLETKANT